MSNTRLITKCLYCDSPADPAYGTMQRCKVCHTDFLREDLERLHREVMQLRDSATICERERVRVADEYRALMAESGEPQ